MVLQIGAAKWRFHGHAIVSSGDYIADKDGNMPECLKIPSDAKQLQKALDAAAVCVLGRTTNEQHPNTNRRKRIVLSSQVDEIEEKSDHVSWWNPRQAPLAEVLLRCAPQGGVVAVLGGQRVYHYFLTHGGYDEFHLTRAWAATLDGGVVIFPGYDINRSAESFLLAADLQRDSVTVLDEQNVVSCTAWKKK